MQKSAINNATLLNRITKINELIKDELGRLLGLEIKFHHVLVTVSRVETTKNLRRALVFFSVYPFERAGEILELLDKKKALLQRRLADRLFMRPLPLIHFVVDDFQEKAGFIDNLIKQSKGHGRKRTKT